MSERKLIFAACVAGALAVSCTPYPEDPKPPTGPTGPTGPAADGTVSDADQQKLMEERKKAQEEAEREIANGSGTQGTAPEETGSGTGTDSGTTGGGSKPGDYEYGTPVPGRPGFVLSPYNQKMVDVRDLPSGTLVQDPTTAASEKKYFRVP